MESFTGSSTLVSLSCEHRSSGCVEFSHTECCSFVPGSRKLQLVVASVCDVDFHFLLLLPPPRIHASEMQAFP